MGGEDGGGRRGKGRAKEKKTVSPSVVRRAVESSSSGEVVLFQV